MRWIWIDSFVAFESGVRAVAIKNVTRAEEYLHDHFPAFAVMPATLMIEGMAQTAGILVGEARAFRERVILAKIRRAAFEDLVLPGDQIKYEAVLESIEDLGAMTQGTVFRNEQKIGHVDLMFSHVNPGNTKLPLPGHNFVFTDQFKSLLAAYRMNLPSERSLPEGRRSDQSRAKEAGPDGVESSSLLPHGLPMERSETGCGSAQGENI